MASPKCDGDSAPNFAACNDFSVYMLGFWVCELVVLLRA